MRVLINRFSTLGQKTGIGHYTAELLRQLRPLLDAGEQVEAFPAGWSWGMAQAWAKLRPLLSRHEKTAPAAAAEARPSLPRRALGLARRAGQAYLARGLRKRLARRRCDLYHEPNTIPFPCDHATVTTLHDLSVILHPEWHPAGRVAFHEKHFRASLSRSRHFITVSEFTRQEVIAHLGIAPERITRIHHGVNPALALLPAEQTAAALERLGLPPRYLLFVGSIEPRKNVLMLLRAYCALPDNLRRDCPLLLVGNWGWNCAEIAAYWQSEGRARGVLHLGYAADAARTVLYNGARALVFPSLYEGFGLPPLEMLACGGAVLASTAAAVVEVVGSKAHVIDPHDVDAWRDAMRRIISDDDWRQSLRDGAVEVARPFTWERCAAETLAVYRRVCAGAQQDRKAA